MQHIVPRALLLYATIFSSAHIQSLPKQTSEAIICLCANMLKKKLPQDPNTQYYLHRLDQIQKSEKQQEIFITLLETQKKINTITSDPKTSYPEHIFRIKAACDVFTLKLFYECNKTLRSYIDILNAMPFNKNTFYQESINNFIRCGSLEEKELFINFVTRLQTQMTHDVVTKESVIAVNEIPYHAIIKTVNNMNTIFTAMESFLPKE